MNVIGHEAIRETSKAEIATARPEERDTFATADEFLKDRLSAGHTDRHRKDATLLAIDSRVDPDAFFVNGAR
jgi:hypothetical protein